MRVRIPTPLRSYTDQQAAVDVAIESAGTTIRDVLAELDHRFPGIRFRAVDEQGRLRQHMRVFVNDEMTRDLDTALNEADELTLMQALSGG